MPFGRIDRPPAMLHVLVLASHAPSLVNFRGPLIAEMVRRGWRVTAAAPDFDGGTHAALVALGAHPVDVPMARTGMNPLADLAYRKSLIALFRRERPDVLLAYTIKPVIWGISAAEVAKVPRKIALITGLGYAFTPPQRPNIKFGLASLAARVLYRWSLPRADFVLFQNQDDCQLFKKLGYTPQCEKVGVTAGSGIDLTRFIPSDPPKQVSFLMLARLLKAKGVAEYAAAASRLKVRYPHVEFKIAGSFDSGLDGVKRADMDQWVKQGLTYLGLLTDVRKAIEDAAVYVLPSYYREGTPRSILEALAIGRAVITTDAPGCRETVDDGVNGFLVPPRDSIALEAAMERFISEPSLIEPMGRASLNLANKKYDVRSVNAQIIAALNGSRR